MPQKILLDSDSEDAADPAEELSESGDSLNEQEDLLVQDEDSDSAPEDVPFTQSKQSALEKVKGALSVLKQEKEKTKLKRKTQQELYEKQKKAKLETLSKSHLPDDVLSELTSKSLHPSKKSKKEDRLAPPNDDILFDEQPNTSNIVHSGESDSEQEEEDFIPLNREAAIRAVCLKEELRKPRSSAEKAMDFRQKQLYGQRIPRQSVKSYLAAKVKKKFSH